MEYLLKALLGQLGGVPGLDGIDSEAALQKLVMTQFDDQQQADLELLFDQEQVLETIAHAAMEQNPNLKDLKAEATLTLSGSEALIAVKAIIFAKGAVLRHRAVKSYEIQQGALKANSIAKQIKAGLLDIKPIPQEEAPEA